MGFYHGLFSMRWAFGISAVLLMLFSQIACADKGAEVRAVTGAHTRIVWLQDAAPEKPCVYSERPTIRLMGLDSDDGKGERAILPTPGGYAKPIITDDGTRVVFDNNVEHTVYVVNWDGTGLKPVVKNATFQDVWTDPRDGVEWIYATVTDKRGDATIPVIRRFRMNNPAISELIWDKTPASMFMVSGDGRVASGGTGEGGNTPQGMFTLPNGNFYQMAGGCWPSMSPDASHRTWVFQGNHRAVHFCVPDRDGKAYGFTSSFANAPGVKNFHEVYHPRWSNNVRYMTMTGPYAYMDWRWASDVKISPEGAAGVEIYLGKFSDDFTGIEQWVIVTSNKLGDYWPDAWIEPDKNQKIIFTDEPVVTRPVGGPSTKDMVFQWENGGIGNQVTDAKTGAFRQCTGQLRDFARFTRGAILDVTGGAFVPDTTDAALLNACKISNQFSLELTLTPTADPPADDAVIFASATKLSEANIVLAQQGAWATLRLKTDGLNTYTHAIPLCRLATNQPNHLVVSYAPGKLTCYLNGKRALVRNRLQGGLSTWTNQHLIFGDAWEGGKNWAGMLEGIALFSRTIDQPEAQQRYAQRSAKLAARPPITRLVVDARLTGYTSAVDPKAIAPYRRCLSMNQYDIEKVITGQCDAKRINVAQWSIMDARIVPTYAKLAKGQSYRLILEAWEDHPEQESERMMTGNEVIEADDTPLFYDVDHAETSALAPVAPADVEWRGPGNWDAGSSWATGTVPGPRDNAVLGNVPAGTRTVTSSAATLRQLTMTQTQPGAVNGLKLGDDLALQGNARPFALTSATTDGLLLDLNGQLVTVSNDTLDGITLAGTVRMAGNGTVAATTVISAGNDYLQAPTVTFSGGGGHGAAAEATMRVTDITITKLGENYTSAPTVTLSEPDIAGGVQATAVAGLNKQDGTIAAIYVGNPGSGYLRAPKVTFSGGGGTGADAETCLGLDGIFVTDGGTGYTTPPTITLTGGNGDGASAQAATQLTTLQYTSRDGTMLFSNTGQLLQDGAAVMLDWAATERNSKERRFANTGSWILQNGAVVKFLSTTGMEKWFGTGNTNTGTMRILSGSRVGLRDFTNTGLLELGAGTWLGQAEFADAEGTLTNADHGVITVQGSSPAQPTTFGYIGPTNGKRTVNNGGDKGEQHAQLLIGSGKDTSVFTVVGGNVYLNNAVGCTVEVRPGATLALLTNDNGSNHKFYNRDAKFTNAGSALLAGKFVVQGNHGGAVMIDNLGALTLQGDAVFERLRSSTGPGGFYSPDTAAQLAIRAGAALQGTGTLTYINSTEVTEGRFLRVPMQGTMAPGTVTAPFGRLALRNANVTVSGTLQLEIGGMPEEPTRFDTVAVDGDEDTGQVELGTGSTLHILSANGVTPHGAYRVLTAKTLTGKFEQLRYNGMTDVPYTVNYLPDGVAVVFP